MNCILVARLNCFFCTVPVCSSCVWIHGRIAPSRFELHMISKKSRRRRCRNEILNSASQTKQTTGTNTYKHVHAILSLQTSAECAPATQFVGILLPFFFLVFVVFVVVMVVVLLLLHLVVIVLVLLLLAFRIVSTIIGFIVAH